MNFFTKKMGGGGGVCLILGMRVGGLLMDGQSNRPKPICPFNFFEVRRSWGHNNALMYKLCP